MKRFIGLSWLIIMGLWLLSARASAATTETVAIDISSRFDGYVNIKVNNGTEKRLKIQIKNGDGSVNYTVYNKDAYVGYLLQDDGGTYTVTLLEETSKNKYKKLMVETFSMSATQMDAHEREMFKAKNIMTWQLDSGGWGKNNRELYARPWHRAERKSSIRIDGVQYATIDNWATVPQIRFLLEMYQASGDEAIGGAMAKGMDFLLAMQYDSGAFPQIYPLRVGDDRWPYLEMGTFNDDATVMVLGFYQDLLDEKSPYDKKLLDESYYQAIEMAFDKGIDFILKSQIEVKGVKTAWCAQHDPVTYAPVMARSYELVSISGFESVNIVEFLMTLGDENPAVVTAVDSAIAWFKDTEVKHKKYDRYAKSGSYFKTSYGDSLWYRFYDIDTNRGFFSDRDGVKKFNITDIGEERRHGYMWAGDWAEDIIVSR